MSNRNRTKPDRTAVEPQFAAPESEQPARAELPAIDAHGLSDKVAANREAILESPSYRLAEYDVDFLRRKENRPLRMQLELLKTETLLREHQIDATVVVFGGTQIVPREQAEAVVQRGAAQRQASRPTIPNCAAPSSGPSGSWPRATSTTRPANSAASSPLPSPPMAAASS